VRKLGLRKPGATSCFLLLAARSAADTAVATAADPRKSDVTAFDREDE
jgi:hypothetical protein